MARNHKNDRVLLIQEPIWETHYRRYVRLVRCLDTAADLLQDLRLKVLEWTLRHGEPKCLRAFVAQAARSVFADWCRAKRRRPTPIPLDDEPLAHELADVNPTPAEQLEAARWKTRVRAVLDAATESPSQRAILATWDEPTDAVAAAIGTTPTAVRTYRHKLARRLRLNRRLLELACAG
jgi:RNA polymerase sigma factor (sigma-70 family)